MIGYRKDEDKNFTLKSDFFFVFHLSLAFTFFWHIFYFMVNRNSYGCTEEDFL